MRVEVTYDGGLERVSGAVNDALARGLSEAAQHVASEAMGVCPVDTGRLRGSISSSSAGNRAEISANTEYASFVEFGTSKMRAQPYLVPSLLQSAGAVTEIIAAAIGDAMG